MEDPRIMDCWKNMVAILSENVQETIVFFKTCSDANFFSLCEVFDEVIANTQSKELFFFY